VPSLIVGGVLDNNFPIIADSMIDRRKERSNQRDLVALGSNNKPS
jgi:hypothetical protein